MIMENKYICEKKNELTKVENGDTETNILLLDYLTFEPIRVQ